MLSMFKQEYATLSIFQDLEPDQLQAILPLFEEVHFPADNVIFEQGQDATNLYILLEGEVHVRYKPYDGPPLTVARILPGGALAGRQPCVERYITPLPFRSPPRPLIAYSAPVCTTYASAAPIQVVYF